MADTLPCRLILQTLRRCSLETGSDGEAGGGASKLEAGAGGDVFTSQRATSNRVSSSSGNVIVVKSSDSLLEAKGQQFEPLVRSPGLLFLAAVGHIVNKVEAVLCRRPY
ncbi:hypothetical protein CSUB01_05134 [Colletotrichum sublineola]|uniref:Uncharacterized protein n=1 Tax=Colletotrichum sublineola TaxID=1173701 RepID=A0A066X5X2_COLSU|nr:hypothetical protein CSUB01_05134 [Colletotrichum sublineola]